MLYGCRYETIYNIKRKSSRCETQMFRGMGSGFSKYFEGFKFLFPGVDASLFLNYLLMPLLLRCALGCLNPFIGIRFKVG